jgi:hypothetical protein
MLPSYLRRAKPTPKKERNWWDKASVISTFLSSVVIAVVGISISASFQKNQLAITQQNNDAQLKISSQKNLADLRLQELKMASDLLEPLLSSDPRKKRIAALMLPSALSDHEICQRILAQLSVDPKEDPTVRRVAIEQLGTGNSKANALVLESVQRDATLTPIDREYAGSLAKSVALGVDMPLNSAFFFASAPGKVAFESSEYGAGVFSYFLTKGLAGEADFNGDGTITVSELYRYLEQHVSQWHRGSGGLGGTKGVVTPETRTSYSSFMRLSGSTEMQVLSRTGGSGKRVALVVGVSKYKQNVMQLQYAEKDAIRVAQTLQRSGVTVNTLLNPSSSELLAAINRSTSDLGQDDSFYFFFSGHGWMIGGENYIGGVDIQMRDAQIEGGVPLAILKGAILRANLKSSFGFFDICQNAIDDGK